MTTTTTSTSTCHADGTVTITSESGYRLRLARSVWIEVEWSAPDLAAGIEVDAARYLDMLRQHSGASQPARDAFVAYCVGGAESRGTEASLAWYADELIAAVRRRRRLRDPQSGYLRLSRAAARALVTALAEYECRPRGADGDHDLSDGACTLPALREIVAFARGIDTGA